VVSVELVDGGSCCLPDPDALAQSNCGVTGVWRFGGTSPGRNVLVCALIHGNEIAGAIACAELLQSPPRIERGSLTIAFCNLRAYGLLTNENKESCRWSDEDMNRVWGRTGNAVEAGDSYELERTRELLPFIEGTDVLLDLHSMHTPGPALGLVGTAPANIRFAQRVGVPRYLISDRGHAAGLRLIDHPRFVGRDDSAAAMLVECGFHFSSASIATARAAVARTVEAYLTGTEASIKRLERPQAVIEVTSAITIQSEAFRFVHEFENMSQVPAASTLIAYDGDSPLYSPYANAWLVMPAPPRYQRKGMTALRFGRSR